MWKPGYAQNGTYTVIFTVSDGVLTASQPLTITVNKVNAPPVLGAIGNKTIKAKSLLSFTVTATDPNNDTLTYAVYKTGDLNHSGSVSPLDVLTIINMVNRGLKAGDPDWNPEADLNGDGCMFAIDALMAINMINSGKAELPEGISINPSTGEFTWTPGEQYMEDNYITIVVSDGVLKDCKSVVITVEDALNNPPSVGTLTPSQCVSSAGQETSFTTTFTDPDGYQDITNVGFVVNTSANYTNCLWAMYSPRSNEMYLNVSGSTWLGPYFPGSSNVMENSFAKLDCSKTTVSSSGTTLTVNWNVTFKSAFIGPKNIYMSVKDMISPSTGLIQKGTVSIISPPVAPSPAPAPTSAPAQKTINKSPQISYLRNSGSGTFSWLGYDPEDKYSITYSYKIDSQAWSAPSKNVSLNVSRITSLKKGAHALSVVAIDSKGAKSAVRSISFKK